MTADSDKILPLHSLTFLVPSQRFQTLFSVTRALPLAVVDEFALRLLAVCGQVETNEFVRFFGFNSREATEVLRSLVARDFVVAPEGLLALSEAGRGLFPHGPGESPRLLEVEERCETLRMDLFDFRLVEEGKGDSSLGACVELDLPGDFRPADSRDTVANALQEQFGAYTRSRGFNNDTRLYAVAYVEPRARFQLAVDADVMLRVGAGVGVELALDGADGPRLNSEAQKWFLAKCGQDLDDEAAWTRLRTWFPWAPAKPPILRGVGTMAALEAASDRAALVGALSVSAVTETLAQFVERQAELDRTDNRLVWMPADSAFWLRSRSAWTALTTLQDIASTDATPTTTLALREAWSEHELFPIRKRFDRVRTVGGLEWNDARRDWEDKRRPEKFRIVERAIPPNVEVVLAPSAWCAAWAWLKLDGPGVPVPIGYVTARPEVVAQVTHELGAAV